MSEKEEETQSEKEERTRERIVGRINMRKNLEKEVCGSERVTKV